MTCGKSGACRVYAAEKELVILEDGEKNLVENYYGKPYSLVPDKTVREGDVVRAGRLFLQGF